MLRTFVQAPVARPLVPAAGAAGCYQRAAAERRRDNSGPQTPMKTALFFLFVLASLGCSAQRFQLAGRKQIAVPAAVRGQLYRYIEATDGVPLGHDRFAFVPVYNALRGAHPDFRDGIYFFSWGAHDSGRLFIRHKGTVAILRNGSTAVILQDYRAFRHAHPLPEATHAAYRAVILSFMRYRQQNQRALRKSGVLQPGE